MHRRGSSQQQDFEKRARVPGHLRLRCGESTETRDWMGMFTTVTLFVTSSVILLVIEVVIVRWTMTLNALESHLAKADHKLSVRNVTSAFDAARLVNVDGSLNQDFRGAGASGSLSKVLKRDFDTYEDAYRIVLLDTGVDDDDKDYERSRRKLQRHLAKAVRSRGSQAALLRCLSALFATLSRSSSDSTWRFITTAVQAL